MMTRMILLFVVMSAAVYSHAQTVSGKITDNKSQPIAGAAVHVLNTNAGAVTDQEGKFEVENVGPGKYYLEITAIGFASVRKQVTVGEGELTVVLNDAYTQLDAVVVTAQKQEEDLQEIPSSISAMSAKQVQQYRVWNTNEITAIIPNLYSANSGDGRNVTSIRGIATTSYDPAVATYIDGVNQFGLDTYIAQLFDVDRIEVLRGPQGTLYGRNSMGGVINIITKQPTNVTSGFLEFGFGNYNSQRFSNGLKLALIPNKLFAGIATVTEKTEGFYTNAFNNSDYDKKNNFTGNYFLKYIANSRLAFTLNVKHSRNKNNGAFPLTGPGEDAFTEPFIVNQNSIARMTDNVFNSSLTAAYAGKRLNFTSQSTYQSNYRYYDKPLDGDFSSFDIISIYNNYGKDWNNVKVFTQEFKFTSSADRMSPWNWTAGTYMYYQKNPVKQATKYGRDAGFYGIPDAFFSTINTTTGKNSGIAFFGQLSYLLDEKLELIGGLRYDYENRELTVMGEFQHDPDPTAFETFPSTKGSVSYSAISPKATVAYRVTNNNNLFVTYSRGFRTGGLTQLSSDPTAQPPLYGYKPEYSNNFEAGFKNTFLDQKVKVNVSAFYTEVTDAQLPTLVLPQAFTVIRNTGSLRSKGLELELAATPVRGLQIEYNAGITNAKYQSLRLPVMNEEGEVEEEDFKGNHQVFTPSSTSMLAVQYQFGLGSERKFKIVARGEWMHLGEQYFDLTNSIRQAPYSLLNTRFGFTYEGLELMFWGRNLTAEKYIAYAYDFGAIHLGNPKTYGVTLRAAF